MSKVLVHGAWDSYYGTGVESYSIIGKDTWSKLQEVCDTDFGFYVHEWSGKHSEEYIEVSELGFTIVTDDQHKIAIVEEIFGINIGNIDLVDYVLEKYEESGYGEDEDE